MKSPDGPVATKREPGRRMGGFQPGSERGGPARMGSSGARTGRPRLSL